MSPFTKVCKHSRGWPPVPVPRIYPRNQSIIEVIQWNLDLRKILGVDKIFLKSRFFLISNTLKVTSKRKPCKMNAWINANVLY